MKSVLRWLFVFLMAIIVPACGGGSNPKGPSTLAAPPTSLVAGVGSTARINLTWVDNSDNEFEFRIERAEALAGPYFPIAVVPMNTQDYIDIGLQPNKQYFYRVTAWNSLGNSASVGPASATTNSLTWTTVSMSGTLMVGRGEHSAIYDSVGLRMLVFGGTDDSLNVLNELRALNLNNDPIPATPWSTPATTGTAPQRFGHSAIYDEANNRMVVFGGQDENFVVINKVHILDLATMAWSEVVPTGTAPVERAYHTAVYDSANQRMIVCGGLDSLIAPLDDVHFLSLPAAGSLSWSTAVLNPKPIARSRHSAVYDALGGRMVAFGGSDQNPGLDGSTLNNETWSLAAGPIPSWDPLFPVGPPSYRMGHSSIWDAANRRMVTFGGTVTTAPSTTRELWAMSLNAVPVWTNLGLTGGSAPANRSGHTAVYDSVRRRMIIYGGLDDNSATISDAWVIKL